MKKKDKLQSSIDSQQDPNQTMTQIIEQDEKNNAVVIKMPNMDQMISSQNKEYIMISTVDYQRLESKNKKGRSSMLTFIMIFVVILLFCYQQLQIIELKDQIQIKGGNIQSKTQISSNKFNTNSKANKQIIKLSKKMQQTEQYIIKLKTDMEKQLRKRVQKKQLFERMADLRHDLAAQKQKEDIIVTPQGTVSELDLSRRFNGLKVYQYLYLPQDRQKRRQYFNFKKNLYLKNKVFEGQETPFSYIDLSQYDENPQNRNDTRQYERLNSIWKLDQVKTELPMCLLASSYNNEAYFRAELNLNSIFQQNYSNYFAIIINDKSIDRSNQIYKRYFEFYNISKDRYIYFNSHMKKDNIQNFYYAASAYCSENSIMVHIDGDDELLGKNVLKVLNSVYQKQRPGFVYSLKHSVYNLAERWFKVSNWPSEYTYEQKKRNAYRDLGMRYFHLRSYQSSLFRKLKLQDMLEDNQHFFEIGYDYVLFLPLIELSCGRLAAIDYNCYLYNVGTGYGQAQSKYKRQQQVQGKILRKEKYSCDPDFAVSN